MDLNRTTTTAVAGGRQERRDGHPQAAARQEAAALHRRACGFRLRWVGLSRPPTLVCSGTYLGPTWLGRGSLATHDPRVVVTSHHEPGLISSLSSRGVQRAEAPSVPATPDIISLCSVETQQLRAAGNCSAILYFVTAFASWCMMRRAWESSSIY